MESVEDRLQPPVVLAVGPDNHAHADLRSMLSRSHYRVLTGRTICDSTDLLSVASVVICEEYLDDGTWRYLLTSLDQMHSPPAIIITSPVAGSRLWAEVLNLGGSDVLAQPFSTEEVLWSVEQAHAVDASTWMGHDQEHAEESPSTPPIGLPENGQRCALLGNEQSVTREKPRVSHTNRQSAAPCGWTDACSIRNGSQRRTLQR